MKNILLIGGAGYIGSVVAEYLLDKGYFVTCFDSFVYQNNHNVIPLLGNQKYRFIYGDMCSTEQIKNAMKDVTDVVLLAGLVGDPITKKYPSESKRVNDDGVLNLISKLEQYSIDRFIFISTCSNYGLISNDDLADEGYQLNPLSLYAKSKVNAEKLILSKKNLVGYSPTILRFATAFGLSPRMRFDLTVNEFTKELFSGNELLVFDADTWRPYCHVKDFARLIDLVLNSPKADVGFEVFNAGGDENNFTKRKIVEEIIKFLPHSKVKYQLAGSDPRNYRVNFNKVKEALGFIPAFNVNDGIAELITAFEQKVFDDIKSTVNKYGNYEV